MLGTAVDARTPATAMLIKASIALNPKTDFRVCERLIRVSPAGLVWRGFFQPRLGYRE
jgi:hypothetical protein